MKFVKYLWNTVQNNWNTLVYAKNVCISTESLLRITSHHIPRKLENRTSWTLQRTCCCICFIYISRLHEPPDQSLDSTIYILYLLSFIGMAAHWAASQVGDTHRYLHISKLMAALWAASWMILGSRCGLCGLHHLHCSLFNMFLHFHMFYISTCLCICVHFRTFTTFLHFHMFITILSTFSYIFLHVLLNVSTCFYLFCILLHFSYMFLHVLIFFTCATRFLHIY